MDLNSLDANFLTESVKLLDTSQPVNEAIVRQCIVLRLLYVLGYNIWDKNEVTPELTDTAKDRTDFLIKRGKGSFTIETKSQNAKFTPRDFQQALKYVMIRGLRYAILTNGKEWVFLDERIDAKSEDRILLTLNIDDRKNFNKFIPQLLDTEVWETDTFALVSQTIKDDLEKNRKFEKLKYDYQIIINDFKSNYGISTLESAVELAIKLGDLPKEAYDILIEGKLPKSTDDSIIFYFKNKKFNARARYTPYNGQWVILAGSIGAREIVEYGTRGLSSRRSLYYNDGKIKDIDEETIEFTKDVICSSASTAIQEIVGKHRNGWEHWKDSEGNLAIKYKPEGKLRNNKYQI